MSEASEEHRQQGLSWAGVTERSTRQVFEVAHKGLSQGSWGEMMVTVALPIATLSDGAKDYQEGAKDDRAGFVRVSGSASQVWQRL